MRLTGIGVLVALAVAACGGGLSGSYSDDSGVVTYEFSRGGTVTITSGLGGTIELDYERDGDRILVKGPQGGNQVLTLTPDGDIDIGVAVLKKQ